MTALMVSPEQEKADRARAPAPKAVVRAVPKRDAKAGVLRSLQKISDDSNAELFSGKAAYAAFGNLRRV